MSIHSHRSPIRRAAMFTAALCLVAAPPVAAQAHRDVAVDSLRRIQEMAPTFGPAGTRVHLSTLNLPVQAKVHVGYGATRTGFEALFEVPQGVWGDIEAQLTVPPTAPWDRAIVFVAFNAIFSPIGLSEPFHVINDEGYIRRTGRVTKEAEACLTFRDQDNYLYALAGDVGGLAEGDEVVLEGSFAPTGTCLDAGTIGVLRVVTGG